ncbi:MAG: DOMON domain-containing protein [Planctomycetota bacterium]|jgi:hypothetical protein
MQNKRLALAAIAVFLLVSTVAVSAAEILFPALSCEEDLKKDFVRKMVYLPEIIKENEKPVIDGVIDEKIWQRGYKFEGFVGVESGKPVPENAKGYGYILRGEKGLYVAVTARDENPPAWKGSGKIDINDPKLYPDGSDGIAIQFNPDRNEFTRYRFTAGRGNTKHSLRHFVIPPWKAEGWESFYKGTPTRVTAEFYIPYKLLKEGLGRDGDIIPINVFKNCSTPIPVPGGKYRYLDNYVQHTWSSDYCHSVAAVDAFPWIYLGSEKSFKESIIPPIARMYLDRKAYNINDEAGDGYIEVRFGSMPAEELSMKLAVFGKDGKEIAARDYGKLKTSEIGFNFYPAKMAAGEYEFKADLSYKGKVIKTASRKFTIESTPKSNARLPQYINLILTENKDIGSGNFVISTGVPFSKGILFDKDIAGLRVEKKIPSNADYKRPWLTKWVPVDAQFTVRNRWYKNGSVKWLGVDFPASYFRGFPKNHRLVFNQKSELKSKGVSLNMEGDNIVIDTGVMKAVVEKKNFKMISEAWLDLNKDGKYSRNEKMINAGRDDGLLHYSQEEELYTAADPATKVWVEEAGKMKVIVIAEGWFYRNGKKEGRHQTRMFFHKDKSYVDIRNTYIITVDTQKRKIRNAALRFGLKGARKYTFGSLDGGEYTDNIPRRGSVYLLQKRYNKFVIENEKRGQQIGDLVANGGKSGGWVSVELPNGQVQLSGRNVWELYPKELEAGSNFIAFHTWPKHGREVFTKEEMMIPVNVPKCLFAYHGKFLDMKCPDFVYEVMGNAYTRSMVTGKVDDLMPRWNKGVNGYIFHYAYDALKANGMGTAMTNELRLELLPPAVSFTEKKGRADNFKAWPHAVADPRWTYQTKVFGDMWPQDTQRFGAIENRIDSQHKKVYTDLTDSLGDYGFLIWPDNHQYPGGQKVEEGTNSPRWFHRTWNNNHYQEGRTMLQLYLRSGKDYYWHYARNSTRHKMDISTVNHAETPRVKGGQTPYGNYHVYCVFGWSGFQGISCHWQNHDYKSYDYFITGDRRGFDQAKGWAREMARTTWATESTRDAAVTLSEAIEVYRAVKDPRLLKTIHWFQEALVAVPIKNFILPHYSQMVWGRSHEYTRDIRVKDRLIEMWNDGVKVKGHSKNLGSWHTMLTLYKITKDKRILALMSAGGYRIGDNPPNISRHMMMAPYLMAGLAEIGASDGIVMSGAVYAAWWKEYFEKWKKEGKAVWGGKSRYFPNLPAGVK